MTSYKFWDFMDGKRERRTRKKEMNGRKTVLIVPILRSIELQIYLMHPSFWGFLVAPSP